MSHATILEIYLDGECIDRREFEGPFTSPAEGETIWVDYGNPSYTDDPGPWLRVMRRQHLLFRTSGLQQTVMLHCVPDPDRGAV